MQAKFAFEARQLMDHSGHYSHSDILALEVLDPNAGAMRDITAITDLDFSDYAVIEVPAGLDNLRAWQQRIHHRPGCVA